MKAEVGGRQHPQLVPWPHGWPVRQGAENLCVMGQTPMLLAPSAAISQPPGLKRRRSAFYTRTARATGLAEPAGRYRTKTGAFFLGYKNSPRLGGGYMDAVTSCCPAGASAPLRVLRLLSRRGGGRCGALPATKRRKEGLQARSQRGDKQQTARAGGWPAVGFAAGTKGALHE